MIVYYTDKYEGGRAESRRLLKKALSEYTGDPVRAETLISELKTGEKGKPYIEGAAPFSVSHTGNVWAVLFADAECGLDIQFERECDVTALSRRVFDPEEAAAIAVAEGHEARGEFFRIWTRREALVKAMGGSVFDSSLPPVLHDQVDAGGKLYTIADISIPDIPGMRAAVCTEGPMQRAVFAELI